MYVGNLEERAEKPDLVCTETNRCCQVLTNLFAYIQEDAFAKFGKLTDVWIARKPPGFGFVEYEDEKDAQDAVDEMNNSEFMGKRLRVEVSMRERGGGGPRGRGAAAANL